MIIYELESDYAHYLGALGAPHRLVRKYAFRNAVLPQVTGLALALGAILGGALVTEIVFSYPGLGYQIYRAITNEDYFVIQGIFLFIIVGVLLANFLVDILYLHRRSADEDRDGRRPVVSSVPTAPLASPTDPTQVDVLPVAQPMSGAPGVDPLRAPEQEARVRPLDDLGAAPARDHRPVHRAARAAGVRGPPLARPDDEERLLVRDDAAGPGRVRAVRDGPARSRSSSARSAAASRRSSAWSSASPPATAPAGSTKS